GRKGPEKPKVKVSKVFAERRAMFSGLGTTPPQASSKAVESMGSSTLSAGEEGNLSLTQSPPHADGSQSPGVVSPPDVHNPGEKGSEEEAEMDRTGARDGAGAEVPGTEMFRPKVVLKTEVGEGEIQGEKLGKR
ncbi:unnamed protein product, partial [Discosporangium mesarthrocarpum]